MIEKLKYLMPTKRHTLMVKNDIHLVHTQTDHGVKVLMAGHTS